jgi:hypothetical protein
VLQHWSTSGRCDCWLVQQLRPLCLVMYLTCIIGTLASLPAAGTMSVNKANRVCAGHKTCLPCCCDCTPAAAAYARPISHHGARQHHQLGCERGR